MLRLDFPRFPNPIRCLVDNIQIVNEFMIMAWVRGFTRSYAGQYTNALKWGERALAAAGSELDIGTLASSEHL